MDDPVRLLEKAPRIAPFLRPLRPQADLPQKEAWSNELFEIASRISLTKSQYDLIEARYETLGEILAAGDDPRLTGAHIFVQGSIKARTAVLPHPSAVGDAAEIDADAVVWLPNAGASAVSAYEAVESRLRAGTRTKRAPTRKNRCVRIHYQDESPAFHMDVTPARNAPGNAASKGDGTLQVPDLALKDWKPSAPARYADWFSDVCDKQINFDRLALQRLEERVRVSADVTQDPLPDHDTYVDFNPLRAAVKLMKAHRDSMFVDPVLSPLRPISIIITTLAARAYEAIANESAIMPRRPGESLIEIVERMPTFIEGAPGNRRVSNPAIVSENFAEKWLGPDGPALEQAFYQWHRDVLLAVQLGHWQFPSDTVREGVVQRAFGPRSTRNRVSRPSALPIARASALIAVKKGPHEKFIEDLFPVRLAPGFALSIDCEEKKGDHVLGRLRGRGRLNRWLPYHRGLRFFVAHCNVPRPFDLYWKVRNVGPAADRKNMQRGQIEKDTGKLSKTESTSFSGEHYVEAYIVKNGVCVARDRIDVPINSQ